ncbi:unnamed protein product [Plutella xylostella]|uniref:(diamondback moth) hypothetical protein n=1 Tax=Plutella xylostella TaxID=51655 RepID=A0A8S4GCZ2_PLUXY|nr:unnamed protein product [Plutella xylostella]
MLCWELPAIRDCAWFSGSDIFPYIYNGGKYVLNHDLPAALDSVFGYVISGKLAVQDLQPSEANVVASTTSLCHFVSYTIEDNVINDTLKRFWEIESLPCSVQLSPEEQIAEDIYSKNHYRDENGRYVSPILLRPDRESLGESYDMAFKRLTHIERRLAKSTDLKEAYSNFMKEYELLDHMELYKGTEPSQYVIPHHCVLRPSSTSTPLRTVFDGSQKTSSGVSLNDSLLTGPKLHRDIAEIITNFRLHEICFSADISKMYRCVQIAPEDRKYQHILWRESPDEPVRLYELKTNTYGLRSAPYIAVRTLHQLAQDEESKYPNAARVLRQGFFVDDLLWSCSSFDEACALQDELMSLLKCGGFDLRKWASNCPELLTRMQTELRSAINFEDDTLSSSLKVLGLTWLPTSDTFSFNYNFTSDCSTKRSVLKLLASIFDPIGFISPCTFLAKCIMQDLWKINLCWDDKLPPEINDKWSKFISDLPCLSDLRIERHMLIPKYDDVKLIAFCDASSRGYAACIYLYSVDGDGNVKVRLMTSKTKVAPIKPTSIPRLELLAAVLLAGLVESVLQYLKQLPNCNANLPIIALSDSSIVLSWLQTPPYKLKTFIANRVGQIVETLPPNCCFHINSENNAADICSRG